MVIYSVQVHLLRLLLQLNRRCSLLIRRTRAAVCIKTKQIIVIYRVDIQLIVYGKSVYVIIIIVVVIDNFSAVKRGVPGIIVAVVDPVCYVQLQRLLYELLLLIRFWICLLIRCKVHCRICLLLLLQRDRAAGGIQIQ